MRCERRSSHKNKQRAAVSGGVTSPGHAHLGIASEESIRDGDVDVKRQRLQDAGLHGDELLPFVCIVTNVQEVVDARRAVLLRDG